MTMTHVNVSVEIHQLASILTITILTLVNVIADLMTAILLSILITKAVAVSAQSIRPAQTINTSMVQLASVNVVTSRNVEMDNTMTMTHVNASVKTHQLACLHTITTQTLVNVIADPMTATLLSILITKAVAVCVQSIRPAQTINTSTVLLASVNAMISRNVEMDNTTIMIHVNANVEIHQLANTHTSMTHTLASAFASLTNAPLTNTLTMRPVVVAVMTIQPVLATSTSTIHHVNASVVT